MELQLIRKKIYEIRGYKVMLDFDLAMLYKVETKVLNQAVKRNNKRFPSDFMFQLTKEEYQILMSQFVTSSWGGTRKLPFAFTEQGVAMLSGILNNDIAIEVNISIMRTFIAMRRLISETSLNNDVRKLQLEVDNLRQYVEEVFSDYNDINDDTRLQLELINDTLAELQTKNKELNKPRSPIGYNAEQYKK